MGWKPPADEVITSTSSATSSWKPPADAVITHDEPTDNRTGLQQLSDFVQPVADAAGRIQASMPYAAGLMAPSLGLQYKAADEMNSAAGKLADPVTEAMAKSNFQPLMYKMFLPGQIPNPIMSAAGGLLATTAANPTTHFDPGASFAGKVMKPVVPAERAFDVATAQKYKLPMTRADYTGDIGTARIETGLGSTITGGGAIQKIAAEKLAAIDRAKEYISSRFGTEQPPSASGLESKLGMHEELGAAGKTAVDLYKDVPNNNLPISNLDKAMNETDFNTIDKGAAATINEIRARLGRQSAPTEETFPKPFSPQEEAVNPANAKPGDITRASQSQYRVGPVSKDLPVVENVANTTGEPHAVFQGNSKDFGSSYILRGDHPRSGGNFSAAQLKEMGIPLKGQTPNAVGQTPDYTGPEPAANNSVRFQKLNEIRTLLSREIQSDTTYNPIAGNQVGPKGQSLIPLKKALDRDLHDYANNATDPLGKMQSADFKTAFDKANTYYGAYKSLQNNKLVQKLSKVPESDIPKTVFGTGRIEDINVAKAALGQKGFNAAKKQFFNDILESKNIDTKLSKYEPEFLKGVFNSEEMNALKEAASLKRTSLTADKLANNPSRTGQLGATLGTIGLLGDAARRFVQNPSIRGAADAAVEAGITLGLPYVGSKAYLATTEGITYSYGAGSIAATKAAASATQSSRKDLHAEFIRRYIKRTQ